MSTTSPDGAPLQKQSRLVGPAVHHRTEGQSEELDRCLPGGYTGEIDATTSTSDVRFAESGTFARVKSAPGLCVRVILKDACTYIYNPGQTGGWCFSYSSYRFYADTKSTSLCSALGIYAPSHARCVCLSAPLVSKWSESTTTSGTLSAGPGWFLLQSTNETSRLDCLQNAPVEIVQSDLEPSREMTNNTLAGLHKREQ